MATKFFLDILSVLCSNATSQRYWRWRTTVSKFSDLRLNRSIHVCVRHPRSALRSVLKMILKFRGMGLENYFVIWARYHVYGIGILFGWLILRIRNGGLRWMKKWPMVIFLYIAAGLCLFIPTYLLQMCFEVDFTKINTVNVRKILLNSDWHMINYHW